MNELLARQFHLHHLCFGPVEKQDALTLDALVGLQFASGQAVR